MYIWSRRRRWLLGFALLISRLSLSVISVFLGFISCPIMDMMSWPPWGLPTQRKINLDTNLHRASLSVRMHRTPPRSVGKQTIEPTVVSSCNANSIMYYGVSKTTVNILPGISNVKIMKSNILDHLFSFVDISLKILQIQVHYERVKQPLMSYLSVMGDFFPRGRTWNLSHEQ